ncbi:AraC family ligand binding domain-containing protein, partial [Escherichia coli]|uniref:AraC family ligand binding domain-containing protein n=1 Tax=Escherichia coli TaxID=562 RepID=UPI003079D2D3
MMHRLNLNGYEPDRHHEAAVAFCIHAGTDELTSPVHQHRKGQLILALHGAITCTVENALWMVPPQYAVWIPGGVEHSNQVTAKEGANKQVISSQVDSLIKISRIWADFFPANTS